MLIGLFQLCAIWTVDNMENVILESAVAMQDGQGRVVSNCLVTLDAKNTGNAEMGLVSVRRDGTDATVHYVRL